MISALKAKHLGATTMFTYSHANTPLGQSERAYYLSYFINANVNVNFAGRGPGQGYLVNRFGSSFAVNTKLLR